MVDFTTTTGDLELHDWHGSKLLAQPVLDALTRFTSEGIIDPAQILGVRKPRRGVGHGYLLPTVRA